jgi:uncharacterized membrane protein YedE/YeeE
MRKLAVYCQLGLGALFGAALLQSGAADFDAMVRMFLFQDAHLFALAGATTLVSCLGLLLLLRSRHGRGVQVPPRPIRRGSVLGGVLFGLGWGLSGTCPGTALAQLGSGRVIALATVLGIVLGNWLFERFASRYFGTATDSCG